MDENTAITMHATLNMMDFVCEAFARFFDPAISDDSLDNICHKVSCALFDSTANETNQSPNTLFQAMKNLLDAEDVIG